MLSTGQCWTEWGYYRYNGVTWINPYDARRWALEENDNNPQIEFIFPAASLVAWGEEPEEPLSELYRRRAQELRDRYGYLSLMYSGGSDSHQAMMAFVRNNIPLDEVRTYYPLKWAEKISGEVSRGHPLGLLFEYRNAVLPGLKVLSRNMPHTKIECRDVSDAFGQDMDCWYRFLPEQHRVTGGAHGLFVANFRARIEADLCEVFDNGKQTGLIYGIDKPPCVLQGSDLYVSFPDHWRMGVTHLWTKSAQLFFPEMFYWGDAGMRITRKQAHLIRKAYKHDQSVITNQNAQRRLIYPDWWWGYQSQGLHGALLKQCTETPDRVEAIARERTAYYNKLNPMDNQDQRTSFLFMYESKRYKIGQV